MKAKLTPKERRAEAKERRAEKEAKRVSLGAEYLDRERPGWWRKIDLARLDMASRKNCILGQLDGQFELSPLLSTDHFGKRCAQGVRLGLLHEIEQTADGLNELWKATILARREDD